MDDQQKTKEQLIAELQEARQQIAEFYSLFEVLPDTVVKVDLQGKVEFVSRGLRGYEREKLIGANVVDLASPQLREEVAALLEKSRAGQTTYLENQSLGSDGQPTWSSNRSYPVLRDKQVVGILTVISDITTQKRAEAEKIYLQQEVIEAQKRAIQELSTPVIPVMERIIVMPLVGSIDSLRARDITRTLLSGIREHRAKVVILDITGVPLVDSGVANHLNKTIQAARLKGAQTIITGVSDAVAETIVDLGIDWSSVETLADLQTGLVVALARLGIKLAKA